MTIHQAVQDAVALSKLRGEQVTLVGPPNLRAAILQYLIVAAEDCDDYEYFDNPTSLAFLSETFCVKVLFR